MLPHPVLPPPEPPRHAGFLDVPVLLSDPVLSPCSCSPPPCSAARAPFLILPLPHQSPNPTNLLLPSQALERFPACRNMLTLATHSSSQQQPSETILFFPRFSFGTNRSGNDSFSLFATLSFGLGFGRLDASYLELSFSFINQLMVSHPFRRMMAVHSIIIHLSIRHLVHSRHFLVLCPVICVATSSVLLGAARACGGRSFHSAVLFRQQREATHWRSLTYF